MIQIKLITALISSVVGVMTMAPVAMSKPHRPVASCSLRYPDHCANINQLVGDPEFRKELSIVLADRREDLFHYKRILVLKCWRHSAAHRIHRSSYGMGATSFQVADFKAVRRRLQL